MASPRAMDCSLSECKTLDDKLKKIEKIHELDAARNVRKNEIVINLLCECIKELLSAGVPSDEFVKPWKLLYEILNAKDIRCVSNMILIKSSSTAALLKTVKNIPLESDSEAIILSCISVFLQSSAVNSAVIADINSLLSLLFDVVLIICKINYLKPDNIFILKEAKSLLFVISNIIDNLSFSTDESKVLLLTESLKEIATFIHIANEDETLHLMNDRLAQRIIAIIFNLKTKEFENIFTHDYIKKEEKPCIGIIKFFLSLKGLIMKEEILYESISSCVVGASLVKKVMIMFLSHNKYGLQPLKVLSVMCALSGLDIPLLIGADSCCNNIFKDTDSTVNVYVISKLLEACAYFPQYFNSTSAPDGFLKPIDWLKEVASVLLEVNCDKNSALFQSFCFLFRISPSIMERNIVPFIKTTLITVTIHDVESKKAYSELFIMLLQVYLKLRQIPKLFVKLLLALTGSINEKMIGNFVSTGQILPTVLEYVATCIHALPYGQTTELWKIFIETYSTFENISQSFDNSEGALFFFAQLFSSFLLHGNLFDANVPPNTFDKFLDLIQLTEQELKKNVYVLKDTGHKINPVQKSFLILCHSLGEVKFAYNECCEEVSVNVPTELSDNLFDCSNVHEFLNSTFAGVLETFLEGGDKILRFLTFRILLQKVKALIQKSVLSGKEENHLHFSIDVILQHLQNHCTCNATWDLDLCTLDDQNYGTAVWRILLQFLPLAMHFLNYKEYSLLCSLAVHTVQKVSSASNMDAKFFLLNSLRNDFFQESKHFQTAFISALWKWENLLSVKRPHDAEDQENTIKKILTHLHCFRKKWLKYAETTPKDMPEGNLNSLWSDLQETSNILNDLLSKSFPRQKLNVNEVQNLLEVIKCLPLEYLLPGNQMKCVIGLSILLFFIPESCEGFQAVQMAKDTSLLLLSIFDGVRSIWLFDFVMSGLYLSGVVQTLGKIMEVECLMNNFDWAKKLIEHVIRLSTWNSESLLSTEQYFCKLKDSKTNQAEVLAVYEVLRKLSKIFHNPHLQEKYKDISERFGSATCSFIVKCMKKHLEKTDCDKLLLILINCYGEVIEIVTSTTYHHDEDKRKEFLYLLPKIIKFSMQKILECNINEDCEVHLQFISKVCLHKKELSNYLPPEFLNAIWDAIFNYFDKKIQKIKEMNLEIYTYKQKEAKFPPNQNSSSHNFFPFHICPVYINSSVETIPSSICNDSVTNISRENVILNDSEINVLNCLSVVTDVKDLALIFEKVMQNMGGSDISMIDVFSFQIMLQVLKYLVAANEDKFHHSELSEVIPLHVSHLQYLISQTCDSLSCQATIVVPILEFIDFLLKKHKEFPKQFIMQSLHFILSARFSTQSHDYSIFIRTFNAVWNVVYDLLTHHHELAISMPAAFICIVSNLLKTIVVASAEDVLSMCDKNTKIKVQCCAQNMNRLLTMLSRDKCVFAKLVPSIIADYVNSVQHVTLDSTIKDHILSGVYRLFGICSEESLKTLAVIIDHSCREIYANLVKNFKQYRSYGTN